MKKLFYLFVLLVSINGFTQCDDPTSMDAPLVQHADCPGTGQITVLNVLPAITGGAYFQYSLHNNTTNSETYTWQNTDVFPNLQAGQYEIRVRRRCTSAPFSSANVLTYTVTVNNNEIPASISSATVIRNDKCSNGEVKIVALGSGPLEYSLINSLTEAEPIATYISPKQPSNRFAGLDAGDYYMRVYNACGNAATIPFTIEQDLSNSNVSPISGRFIAIGCDSISFTFRVNQYLKNTTNFPSDVNVKAWIKWPSGSVDTITLPNQSNSSLLVSTNRDIVTRTHLANIDPAYSTTIAWPNN